MNDSGWRLQMRIDRLAHALEVILVNKPKNEPEMYATRNDVWAWDGWNPEDRAREERDHVYWEHGVIAEKALTKGVKMG